MIFPATDSLRSALPLTFTATAAKLFFSGGGGTITPAAEWSSLKNARGGNHVKIMSIYPDLLQLVEQF